MNNQQRINKEIREWLDKEFGENVGWFWGDDEVFIEFKDNRRDQPHKFTIRLAKGDKVFKRAHQPKSLVHFRTAVRDARLANNA